MLIWCNEVAFTSSQEGGDTIIMPVQFAGHCIYIRFYSCGFYPKPHPAVWRARSKYLRIDLGGEKEGRRSSGKHDFVNRDSWEPLVGACEFMCPRG